jgi:hypothetical protein
MQTRQRLSKLIGPLVLIILGLLLLFYNLGVIDANLWEFIFGLWPLLVMAAAVSMLLGGGSLFFPLALIAFAAGFLIDNLGLVEWEMWETLGRLWPLFLVAVGLDVLVLSRLRRQTTHSEEINLASAEAASARVKLAMGIGRMRLQAGRADGALASGSAQLGPDESLKQSLRLHRSEARIKIEQSIPWHYFFTGGWLGERHWQLNLNPALPISLDIDGGLGDRTLDLHSLNLTRLEVDGGIGALTLTLPAQGQLQAKIDGGIGDKTVYIPAGVGARIEIDSGLGSRQVRGVFSQQGKVYATADAATAPNRLDLKIDHGFGSLTVVQMAAAEPAAELR